MRWVEPLPRATRAELFGNKAAQLAALCSVPGCSVPRGFAVSATLFRAWIEGTLPPSQWPERLLLGPARERRGDRLLSIRKRLLTAPLPVDATVELLEAYRQLGGGVVAVRSSALHEDARASSAAGLQETVLGVQGDDALLDGLRECFASLYGERAMAYLARLSQAERTASTAPAVAAVVQTLVPAEKAGVLFTVDPLGQDQSVMVLEAAPGLGVSVVDGSLSPDIFRLDRRTGTLRSYTAGLKPHAVRAKGASLEKVELSEKEQSEPCLSSGELERLTSLAHTIERTLGGERDIEWAFADKTLWVLQARPVVRSAKDVGDRATWVWSNVNVGEALPGVASPLTWSVAVNFSDQGFRRAFATLGCAVPDDAELVGQFHGRIYLNLSHFMRIASQVPLLDPGVLLEFGGGGGLEEVRSQVTPGSWTTFLLRAPKAGARVLSENALLDRHLDTFEQDFRANRERFETLALHSLPSSRLVEELRSAEQLLDRTGQLMLTCASNSLGSILALRTLLRVVLPADAARLEQELLTGNADLETAAPGVALLHLAAVVRRETATYEALMKAEPAQLRAEIFPEGGAARRAFDAFLRAYGYRAAREAELLTPRWREAPQPLLATLRGHLEGDIAAALARVERPFATRASAEKTLEEKLPPIARAGARHLLARTRRFVRLRERMRARVTEVLGFFRTLALEVSERLQREGVAATDGAFFLHLDELYAYLRHEPVDVAALVAARRAEYLRDVARPDPPSTFVGAPPPVPPSLVPAGDRLSGVAASGGCVTGTVRVLRSPEEGASLRAGEVLVTPVTDVGWTPLFLIAAAVVTELGGALSHAAVVAREYGVPAVVNVRGATKALHTGDRVRIDGDRGTIEVLERVREATSARSSKTTKG